MKSLLRIVLASTFALNILPAGAFEPLSESVASPAKRVSVTVYNQEFGIVREERVLNLKGGINFLRVENIAEKIDPTTVSFKSLSAPASVSVIEQNYQYDLLNSNSVLNKSVGKSVSTKHYTSDGRVTTETGFLLAPGGIGNLMLKTAHGIILNAGGETEINDLPAGLVPKPSLLWKLQCDHAGEHSAEIAYQTKGLKWNCDYVAIIDESETKLDLTAWVTLVNQSGATFKQASLKLLAGDVHNLGGGLDTIAQYKFNEVAEQQPKFQERSFSDYHLYTLNGKTDLNDKETKQISLFNADNIGAVKTYIFDSQKSKYFSDSESDAERRQKIATKLEVENSEQNRLGMALPRGRVRVFKKDLNGALQFIGEDSIDHTPSNEKVRLTLGDSFDLVAQRKQTGLVDAEKHTTTSYEIKLRNHKKTDVIVCCIEHAAGQWKITDSSHQFTKKTSEIFEFAVPVPANGETVVTYTIENKN